MDDGKLREDEVKILYEIYERYGNFLFATSLKILKDFQLAEDCMQNVLLELAERNIPKLAGLNEERKKRYLYVVTRNMALNMEKKRQREIPEQDPGEKAGQSNAEPQEDMTVMGNYGFTADMDAYLENLNTTDRKILDLKYSRCMSNQQIAEKLHKPIPFVSQRVSRARKKLGRLIEEKDKQF